MCHSGLCDRLDLRIQSGPQVEKVNVQIYRWGSKSVFLSVPKAITKYVVL